MDEKDRKIASQTAAMAEQENLKDEMNPKRV